MSIFICLCFHTIFRTPYGLWRKILEDTETIANARLKVSQTLTTDVIESIKTLKTERATTIKKVHFTFYKG